MIITLSELRNLEMRTSELKLKRQMVSAAGI